MRNASIKKLKEGVCSPKRVSSHSCSHDVMTTGVIVPSSPLSFPSFPLSVPVALHEPSHTHTLMS